MSVVEASSLDLVTSGIIDAVDPIRLRVTGAEDCDAVFRLRFEAALEYGWIGESELEGGLERDEHDDDARFVVALDGDEAVATARLVMPSEHGALPVARAFGVRLGVPAIQLDRLTIAAMHRGDPEHRLVLAVLARAAQEVGAEGVRYIVGAASAPLLALYRALDFDVAPIGVPRIYWGERRQLFMVDLRRTVERLAARD